MNFCPQGQIMDVQGQTWKMAFDSLNDHRSSSYSYIIAGYRQGQHTPMTSRLQGQGQTPFIVTGVWPLNSFDGSVGHLGPRNSNAVRFTINAARRRRSHIPRCACFQKLWPKNRFLSRLLPFFTPRCKIWEC